MTFYRISFLFLLNVGIWLVIHLVVSLGLLYLPKNKFHTNRLLRFLFKSYRWEKEGSAYNLTFQVKDWKDKLPDGASLFSLGYVKKQLPSSEKKDIAEFIMETKRAELTHWLIMMPAPMFFLWNPVWAAWINVVYAILINIPFIMIQRYNRPRLQRIKRLKERKVRTETKKRNKSL